MTPWSYHNPVCLRFGEGCLDEIGDAIRGRPFVLVTDPDPALDPWRATISRHGGEPILVLNDIASNPSMIALQALCAPMTVLCGAPALVVALGGGSVMDAAKFIAAAHGDGAAVARFLSADEPLARPPLPIVAIPTTAGTGSEVTRWATIWDTANQRKLSLELDGLYAETAIVDPRLSASVPWSVTLSSGLDALSHALESLWNVNANPITRAHAVRAAQNLMQAFPRLQRDLRNKEARSQMALGALQAGLAFSNTRTAIAHSISYPITLTRGVPHGIACSFCLPDAMAAAIGADAACDAALSEIFGPLSQAPRRLSAFLSELGAPTSASAFGIEDAEWRMIVDRAFAGPRGRNFIGLRERFAMRLPRAGGVA